MAAKTNKLLGSMSPRLFTPPLRKLTPATSSGFHILQWLQTELNWNPLPWQRWVIIAAHELKPDGTFRFKEILLLVARQNGKTELLTYLSAYWLAHDVNLILGTSASVDTAQESWANCADIVEDHATLYGGKPKIRYANGEKQITAANRNRFKIVGATRRGGRGLSADRLVEDELREHLDWLAHAAASNTTTAKANSQIWMLSNAGDERSVVLNHYRALGVTGDSPTLGFFEYSAPEGCEIDDRQAWAQANPALGYLITEEVLLSKLNQPASIFRTENLCQTVKSLDEAIDPTSWANCLDPGTMDAHRSKIACFLDLSPDMKHSTLCAATPLKDGRVRIEVIRAWETTSGLRKDLPDLLKKVNPRVCGWLQNGPVAAMAAELRGIKQMKEVSSRDISAACVSFAEMTAAGRIAQNGDELLASHVLAAKKLPSGELWKFSRKDGGQCDAAYAAAGAVFLAKQIPVNSKLKVITADTDSNPGGING